MDRAEAIKELMPFTLCDVYSDNLREACRMAIAALRERDATDTNVGHKTNADRIRAMTDEELADLIVGIMSRQRAMILQRFSGELPNISVVEMPPMAKAAHLQWLQQPADHFRDPTKMMGGAE